jgi:hypothetical protein
MRRVTVFVISLCLGSIWTSGARADESPLAVAVESANAQIAAPRVREAVARALNIRVVSLLDAHVERTRGTLAVVVARDGRSAQLFFQARAGRRQLTHVAAPSGERGAAWIGLAVADFVRASLHRARWTVTSEVLDPFTRSDEPWPVPVTSEVLDPWATEERDQEPAEALGRPRPR